MVTSSMSELKVRPQHSVRRLGHMSPSLCSYGLAALFLGGWLPGSLRAQAPSQAPDTTADATAFVCDWHPRPPLPKRVVVDLLLEAGISIARQTPRTSARSEPLGGGSSTNSASPSYARNSTPELCAPSAPARPPSWTSLTS